MHIILNVLCLCVRVARNVMIIMLFECRLKKWTLYLKNNEICKEIARPDNIHHKLILKYGDV